MTKVQQTRIHHHTSLDVFMVIGCWATLHEECLQHHGHKGDPEVTPKIYGTIGDRAPDVKNASYPQRLGVTRIRS